MINMISRRTGVALLTALACVAGATTGCDQAPSAPAAKTTPAANTSTDSGESKGETVVPVASPPETDQIALNQNARPDPNDPSANLTPAERLRLRNIINQENAGVVFSEDPDSQPRLIVDGKSEQHAGTVYTKEPVDFVFKLKNAGTGDLIINRISSSCGCTVPDRKGLVDIPFGPGAEIPPLNIAYRPKRPGNDNKAVTLFTNDPVNPVVRLRIGAELASLAIAYPEQIRPGELRAGRTHIVPFEVYSRDTGATIKSIKAAKYQDKLTFEWDEAVPIEDPESEYKVKIPVRVILPKTLDAIKINAGLDITVMTTPPGQTEQVAAPVVGRLIASIAGDLRFNRPFARITLKEQGEPYSFAATLSTASGSDFNITSVTAIDRKTNREIPLEVSYEKVEDARVPTWALTFKGVAPDAGPVNGQVVVHSDLKDEPPAKLVFTGFVPVQRLNTAEVERQKQQKLKEQKQNNSAGRMEGPVRRGGAN